MVVSPEWIANVVLPRVESAHGLTYKLTIMISSCKTIFEILILDAQELELVLGDAIHIKPYVFVGIQLEQLLLSALHFLLNIKAVAAIDYLVSCFCLIEASRRDCIRTA